MPGRFGWAVTSGRGVSGGYLPFFAAGFADDFVVFLETFFFAAMCVTSFLR
jgi:hypothetical protein